MIVELYTASKPSRPKNDDIAGFEGSVFWLLDGATQLVQPDHGKDASWYVGALDKSFRATLKQTPEIALSALAKTAINNVATEFYAATGLTATAPQELRPFATLVLCRLSQQKDYLDYLVVCDSTLAVLGPNSETVITDASIEKTDPLGKAYDLLRQGHNFQSPEYKEELCNVYEATSKRINAVDGFGVIGQDETVIDRALMDRIPLSCDDHILLMSDGFTRAIDTLGIFASWKDLLKTLEQRGGDYIITQIRTAEKADSGGVRYQRSSIHDDATLLWLKPAI